MNSETIVYCVVALLLGMLIFHMLKVVCGCKLVEGMTYGLSDDGSVNQIRFNGYEISDLMDETYRFREGVDLSVGDWSVFPCTQYFDTLGELVIGGQDPFGSEGIPRIFLGSGGNCTDPNDSSVCMDGQFCYLYKDYCERPAPNGCGGKWTPYKYNPNDGRGNKECWSRGLDYGRCCDDEKFGEGGNQACWDDEYTYDRCCNGGSDQTEQSTQSPPVARVPAD